MVGTVWAVGVSPNTASGEHQSNSGIEFWAVDLENIEGGASGQFAIVVANNGASTANVTVTDVSTTVANAAVAPGAVHTFALPRRMVTGTVQTTRGVYRVSSDQPIVAYQFNPLHNAFTNDASLLLPTHSLGREYLMMSKEETLFSGLGRGISAVIATQPGDTQVSFLTKANTVAGAGIPAAVAGTTITRTLKQFEVLNLETASVGQDFTGSAVSADKPVAVFGGTKCSNIPGNVFACDHLEEQMFPVATWGKVLPVCHSPRRGTAMDVVRVLARENQTTVTLPDGSQKTLNAGEFAQVNVAAGVDGRVSADKPILVGQFLVGQDAGAGIGDPSMLLMVPQEQFRNSYLFLTPSTFRDDYLVVTAPKGATVNLDGSPMDPSAFRDLGSTGLVCGTVKVADGAHRVTSDQKVGIAVYGYDTYASYAYAGGLDLGDPNCGDGLISGPVDALVVEPVSAHNQDVGRAIGDVNCNIIAKVLEQMVLNPIIGSGPPPLPPLGLGSVTGAR